METLRTPEQLKNPDYNYYLAYVIDPAEKDAKKIETALAQRKNSFTQGTDVQRTLKDLYTEAVKIMTDKALREEEFKNAKKIKLETAEKLIVAIVKGRGVIYKSDLMKIADASGRWLTVDEIEKKIAYLQQQGAKIVDDTKRSLDFLTYDKIERLLKTIGKSDLYDLLSVTQSTSVNTLQNALSTTYNTVTGIMDAKSAAMNQVCGEAKMIFKDENSKKYYDVYLATKDIWAEFALRRSCGIWEVELKEFLHYSERAKNALKTLGITDVDYIEALLAGALNFYRIAVAGGEERRIDLKDCPYCGMAYANNNNPKTCPHCHNPLEIVCWNCGGKVPYTVKNKICPSCGATIDHRDIVDTIVKKDTGGSPALFMEKCIKSYGLAAQYNGVEIVKNIIIKNTVKPAHEEREFGISSANQRTINLRVYENNSLEEEASIDESTQMYETCEISLTPGLPEDAPINIIFDLDDNGILTITAVDLTNNIPLTVTAVRKGEATDKRARLT